MEKDKKKISGKEKRRLKILREQKDQGNTKKQNFDFIFPKKRDIRFKNPEKKK